MKLYRNKKYLEKEYIIKHRSAYKIADNCDCSEITIRRWLRRHGLKVRTISEALLGRTHSKKARGKMSEVKKGKLFSDEHKVSLSNAWTLERRTKQSKIMTEQIKDPEFRGNAVGANSPSWRGGVSFEPYCHLFNNKKKEEIRNRDNRVCQLCNKSEILNGKRLSAHHIDSNKMQGCNGTKWLLTALCSSCNGRPDTIEKEFLLISKLMWRIKK